MPPDPESDNLPEAAVAVAAAAFQAQGRQSVNSDLASVLRHEAAQELSSEHNEPFSPRRGFTFKRPEEPPRNENDKMICRFQNTCSGITFERKCEWSKHMDKHERPYKCEAAGCEKLQGFTYSGGLLRHQREVHKMHGGTKEALYCPFPNCKRSSGSGFTRKENRDEHIRRVHRRSTDGSDPIGDLSNKRDRDTIDGVEDMFPGGEAGSSVSDDLVNDNIDPSISGPKRRRLDKPNGANGVNGVNGTAVSNRSLGQSLSSDSDLATALKLLTEKIDAQRQDMEDLRRENEEMREHMGRMEASINQHIAVNGQHLLS